MSETPDKKEYFDLDEVLDAEVKFGRYQIIQFLLIAFPIFLNGIFSSSYIFTAGTLNYRCKVPECESGAGESSFLPDWINLTTPFDSDTNLPEKCERFAPSNVANTANSCSTDSFNQSTSVKCDKYIYEDDEVTILNEFNLNCDKEFYLSLIGTINNVGQMFCYLVTGVLSDRYGRKFVLILGCLGSSVFGILRSLSFNYAQFATFEFLDSFFGAASYSTAYIIGLELVTPRFRTIFGTLLNCFYAFGEIYLGLIAMWFRDYKVILLITYVPSFLIVSYIWILPQSIRWLMMKGYNEKAKKILVTATKANKTTLSNISLEMLDHKVDESCEIEEGEEGGNQLGSLAQMVLLIANISYLWFATIFVYYGLNINAVYLDYWNKYTSYIVVCLIELPSYFITNVLMEKIGRKKTLFFGMIGSGTFCIVSELISGDLAKTITFVIGKMLITISFSCLYIFTIEIFPTNLRHRFFSICSVVGRIGSILTPLTPILAQQISPRLPLIIFSGLSLSSALLLCTLPETLNRKLPNSVSEAFT